MLEVIKDYIVKNYPESCLSININEFGNDYDKHDLLEECIKFFYYDKLDWCGCGRMEEAWKLIRDYLRIVSNGCNEQELNERFGVKYICDDTLLMCLAYSLDADRVKLTSHGGSINRPHLTQEGAYFLWLLREYFEDGESESEEEK